MPISPQILDDVEEPMPARPATLKDPGTPDRIVKEQHSLTHFPSQPWCKMCVDSRDGFTASRIVENRRQLCLNFSLTTGTWEMEALCRLRVSLWEQTPLLSHPRDDGARLQEMDMPCVVAATAKWCGTWGYECFCLHEDKEGVLQLLLEQSGERMSS